MPLSFFFNVPPLPARSTSPFRSCLCIFKSKVLHYVLIVKRPSVALFSNEPVHLPRIYNTRNADCRHLPCRTVDEGWTSINKWIVFIVSFCSPIQLEFLDSIPFPVTSPLHHLFISLGLRSRTIIILKHIRLIHSFYSLVRGGGTCCANGMTKATQSQRINSIPHQLLLLLIHL